MRGCLIERERRDDLDIIHLEGFLDAYSFPRLENVLSELEDQDRNRVILDCARLNYISSAALGVLIGFSRRAHDRNGDLRLAHVSSKIMGIIELLGFHKILEISPDVDTAVSIFAGYA